MLWWIVRVFLILAAPITALMVSRYTPQFELVQTFVAMILMVGVVALAAAWSKRETRASHDVARRNSDR